MKQLDINKIYMGLTITTGRDPELEIELINTKNLLYVQYDHKKATNTYQSLSSLLHFLKIKLATRKSHPQYKVSVEAFAQAEKLRVALCEMIGQNVQKVSKVKKESPIRIEKKRFEPKSPLNNPYAKMDIHPII